MADLDTRDKRGSSISKLGVITIYPNPDGTVGTSDRVQTVGLYAGITPGAAAANTRRLDIMMPPKTGIADLDAWLERLTHELTLDEFTVA